MDPRAALNQYGELPTPKIHLTTVHSAKGREADLVIVIPDMTRRTYEAYLDSRSGGREAENRVAYVAVTRAKHRLIIVAPQTTRYFGYPYIQVAKPALCAGSST